MTARLFTRYGPSHLQNIILYKDFESEIDLKFETDLMNGLPDNIVSILCKIKKKGHWQRSDELHIGQSLGFPRRLSLEDDFGKLDSTLIFISTEMGTVDSYLLDVTRGKIRVLYKQEGHVWTNLEYYKGTYRIHESWQASQYYDTFGIHGKMDRNNCVSRYVNINFGNKGKEKSAISKRSSQQWVQSGVSKTTTYIWDGTDYLSEYTD